MEPKNINMHTHTHTGMVKVISLSEVAYKELKEKKKEEESFSDVVLRLIEKNKKTNLLDFFGKWPGDKKELDKIEKELYRERKKFKLREVKL